MTAISIAAGSPLAPAPATNVQSVASGVRLRVLVPLAVAMILLFVVTVSVFLVETKHRQTEDIARTAASVDVMFHEQSAPASRSSARSWNW